MQINKVLFIVVVSTLFFSNISWSQSRTKSPFSSYGLGEFSESAMNQGRSMGNTGIALSSNKYINSNNPASYSSFDSLAFYLEVGASAYLHKFTSADKTASENHHQGSFDYLVFGFPINKRVSSVVGLKPYTVTGYNFTNERVLEKDTLTQNGNGDGNINQVFWGLSIKPIKNLSVGINASYFFGSSINYLFAEFATDGNALKYCEKKELRVKGLDFQVGGLYKIALKENNAFVLGATFKPEKSMRSKYYLEKTTGTTYTNDMDGFADPTVLYAGNDEWTRDSLEFALSYGMGLTWKYKNMIVATVEYEINNWGNARFPSSAVMTNANRVAGGFEITPNAISPNFVKRVSYRVGGYSKNEPYVINNAQLKNFGLTAGFSMPTRSKTYYNIAVDWGKRYTDDKAFSEMYWKINLSISLNEYWFMQRKFD